MTDDLLADLMALAHALDRPRLCIYRIVIGTAAEDFRPVAEIYRGSLPIPHDDSPVSEPPSGDPNEIP